MPKRKRKERGRPLKRKYPPKVDATAEEMAQAIFRTPVDHEWEYEAEGRPDLPVRGL